MAKPFFPGKNIAFACVVVLFSSGCALFKKPCDCPKWDFVPVPEREYDVHGKAPLNPTSGGISNVQYPMINAQCRMIDEASLPVDHWILDIGYCLTLPHV